MRASARFSAPVMVAALAFGGLAVAMAPSAAACGGYGEPACQTFTLSFNANGGVCNPSTVSATENTWATLLSGSQCTRSGFTLASWATGSSTFAPGAQVFVTGNAGFTANWTSTSSPTATPTPTGGTSTPTTGPTESPTATPSPTVTIPPGQTNPDTRVVAAPGVVVVPQSVADRTTATEETGRTSRRAAVRNAVELDRGDVAQVRLAMPGNRASFSVSLETPAGERVSFGTLRSDRNGEVLLPAIRYTIPGTYVWSLVNDAGQTRFTAVNVSR